jgi:uncharacterized membrane protein SpoIIM required for sporulation
MTIVYLSVLFSWILGAAVFGIFNWTLIVLNLYIIEQMTGLLSGAVKDFREWNIDRKSANLPK